LFVRARPHVFKEVNLKITVKLWVMPSSLEESHRQRVEKNVQNGDGKHFYLTARLQVPEDDNLHGLYTF